ncbi:MAG: hypothetical protein COA53_00895 [Rhodobacteraceae bacterium]|nr:MAG: hypothetical protein COA53_00895 [Paracoccaceae bacterium]
MNLPQNADLRAVIEATYKGRWRKIYRDALRDNEQAVACPTKAWKHALPVWDEVFVEKRAHVVFCVRNPYSWALSLARTPYHQKGPKTACVVDFVTQPWLTVSRDNMEAVLRSPMDLWNGKVEAYGAFMRQGGVPTRVIRFEDFVSDPVAEVRQVLMDFEVPFGDVRAVASTKSPTVTLGEISGYYQREDWKKSLTGDVVLAINEAIDWELAAQYGYYRLNPSDFPSRGITWKNWFRSRSLMLRSGSR